MEEGKWKPDVSHSFELDDFKEAFKAKWTGEVIGGCVCGLDVMRIGWFQPIRITQKMHLSYFIVNKLNI